MQRCGLWLGLALLTTAGCVSEGEIAFLHTDLQEDSVDGGPGGSGASGGQGQGGSGGQGGGGGAGTCTRSGFDPVSQNVIGDTTDNGNPRVSANSLDSNSYPVNLLQLRFWQGYGAVLAPQSFEFDGESLEDCGVCLTAGTLCNDESCQQYFLAQSGELDVESLSFSDGSDFYATLRNATLAEVSADSSTVLPGGDRWCISRHTWSGELQME